MFDVREASEAPLRAGHALRDAKLHILPPGARTPCYTQTCAYPWFFLSVSVSVSVSVSAPSPSLSLCLPLSPLSLSLSLSLSFSRSCAWKPRWCCRSGFRRSRRAGPFHANRIRPVHTKGLMRAVLSGVRLAGNRPAVPQAGDAGSTFE